MKRKAASIVLFALLDEDETSCPWKRGKTREWIKRRPEKGYFNNIVRELRMEDTRAYKEIMRMNYEQFIEIVTDIEPIIAKK